MAPASLFDPDAEEIVQKINPQMNQGSLEQYMGYVWWITPDEFNIFIQNTPGTSISVSNQSANDFETVFQRVVDNTDKILLEEGFIVNTRNSSENLKDDIFYDYVRGYENTKKGLVCTLTLDGDTYRLSESVAPTDGQGFTFSCSTRLQRSYNEQVPLLRGLDRDHSGLVVTQIDKMIGDFVVVSLHGRRAGTQAVLKKENGAYHSIFYMQEPPSCEIVDKYNIPEEIYEECYLPDNISIRTRQ